MCTSCSCVYTSMYRILFAHFQLPDVHRSDALLRFIAIFWVTEASKWVYLNRFSVSTYTFFCLLHRHGKLTTWNFDDCFMLIIFFYCLFFFSLSLCITYSILIFSSLRGHYLVFWCPMWYKELTSMSKSLCLFLFSNIFFFTVFTVHKHACWGKDIYINMLKT